MNRLAVVIVHPLNREQHTLPLAEVGFQHERVQLDLIRCSFGDSLSKIEHRDALAQVHDHVHVMLDQDDGQLHTLVDPPDQLDQLERFLRIHAGRRLVEQEESGLQGERSRHFKLALKTVGQRPRNAGGILSQVHYPKQLHCASRSRFSAARTVHGH